MKAKNTGSTCRSWRKIWESRASVIFRNRFVSPEELVELIGAADIYITPYKHKGQVVSGTLAYALSAGKAIISTPYLHAIELLDDERGVLVPFDDPQAIAAKTIELLDNGTARHAMRKRAYLYTRDMVWNRVAQQYMGSFERVYNERLRKPRATFSAQNTEKNLDRLPAVNLDHLVSHDGPHRNRGARHLRACRITRKATPPMTTPGR